MQQPWLQHYPPGVPHTINPDRYPNLLALWADVVRQFGPQPAFVNLGQALTYNDLDRHSSDFAAYLQHGLRLPPGERIALMMPNLLQYPVALLGALKAGLVIVNTNPLYTPREMQHQFADSGARVLVILANFAHQLPAVLPHTQLQHVIITEVGDALPNPKRWLVNWVVRFVKKMVPPYTLPNAIRYNEVLARGRSLPRAVVNTQPADLALVQYTGGTTGVSKGAMLTHRNIVANIEQAQAWLGDALQYGKETVITALPLYHIFAFTVNCMLCMKLGTRNVLITNPRDMPNFLKDLRRYPFSLITGVNTLFNGLLNQEKFRQLDFSKLKISAAGGMALQTAVAERWRQVTGNLIFEGYGMTETSPATHFNPTDPKLNRLGTIGMPLPSTECIIIGDDDQPLPAGQRGELCIRGPQVMLGYWQRPDETAQVMLPNGFMRTGDIAVMDEDGYFRIVDRKKEMISVSGFKVFPNEVEEVLSAHPDVLEVACIGVPDDKTGEAVKVFIVKRNPALTADTVHQYCKENFTGYKQPKYVEFRTELPKTNVGKILRRALKEEVATAKQ